MKLVSSAAESVGMRTTSLLVALLLCLGTVSAVAEPRDDAYAILIRARLALGGDAWDKVKILHSTMDLYCGGLEGRQESWSVPAHGSYATHYRLGPDRGAESLSGNVAWSADWAGRVHEVERANAGELRATAFWSSFAFLFADRHNIPAERVGSRLDGDRIVEVVRLSPPGLRGAELWLDAQTARPARLILRGAEELVVTYADYRPVAGLTLPFRITVSAGLSQNDQRLVIEHVDIEEPSPDLNPFARPSPAPPDYLFTKGDASGTADLTATGNALLVDVMIDGHGPYPFALDTGAATAIDSALADELGLAVSGKFGARGAGELPVEVGLTRMALAIGDVRLSDQLVRVLPLVALTSSGKPPFRGLLGHEIFDRFVVRIDQDHRRVQLWEPTTWAYHGDARPIAFRIHGGMPMVDGAIDGVEGRFTLDTGQANSVTLFRSFMIQAGIERKYVPKMNVIVGEGVGGPIRAEVARGRKLTLGDVSIDSPVLYLSLQKSGGFSSSELAGNVGGAVFLSYNAIFDYSHQRVYFERSAAFGKVDSLALMSVQHVPTGLRVVSVLPGGPVAEAGVRPDDVIESINSRDAAHLDYFEIQRMFRRPAGTKVEMWVRTKGGLQHIVIVLAEVV
jgi:hypothetical protein